MEKLHSNKSHFLRNEESQTKVKGNKKNFKLEIGLGIFTQLWVVANLCVLSRLLKKIKHLEIKNDRSAFFM